ncbi:MAG: class I SAM-dependent methyltransferase [Candidatus Omnitrophota bacterium]|nr:class I SAM-dependent methyltransferase [Candidatus Omnitrophota bacterium]
MPRYNLERHLSREEALHAPQGALDFRFCTACLFAFNAAFVPESMDYAVDYEASRASSGYFKQYLDQVCEELSAICAVEGKRVVEVGCGDGQFLLSLRRKHPFEGYGFDPSAALERIANPFADVRFIRGYYGPEALPHAPDVVILRHILEHQGDPHRFLQHVLASAQGSASVYVEVPAWEWVVDRLQLQAFSYEHCSYYSRWALQRALEQHGFFLERVAYGFADEYLQYYASRRARSARLHDGTPGDPEALMAKTEAFARMITDLIEGVRDAVCRRYRRAVLWGAAGKGTTFLNIVGLDDTTLEYVVDSNPRRHDTFIPCTGQRVVAPEFLARLRPSQVLLTNPLYRQEIGAQLQALGLHPELIAVDDVIHQVARTLSA